MIPLPFLNPLLSVQMHTVHQLPNHCSQEGKWKSPKAKHTAQAIKGCSFLLELFPIVAGHNGFQAKGCKVATGWKSSHVATTGFHYWSFLLLCSADTLQPLILSQSPSTGQVRLFGPSGKCSCNSVTVLYSQLPDSWPAHWLQQPNLNSSTSFWGLQHY